MGSGSDSVCTMYVELEHSLVPGNIQDINEKIQPPDFSKGSWDEEEWKHKRTPRYTVVKKDVMEILADKENKSRINQDETNALVKLMTGRDWSRRHPSWRKSYNL